MNGTRGLVIAIAAALIVGCSLGVVGGVLLMRVVVPPPHRGFAFDRDGPPPPIGARDPRGPEGARHRERMISHLERELDLTPAQRERVIAQLDRAREAHAAVRESMQVWLDRELTPAQRERWKQVEAKFERSRRGPGRHGGRRHDRD